MTLQQLKYAITVAQTGTITEAAEKLYISQPSLTNAIHELEKEMNIEIFTRTNKGIIVSKDATISPLHDKQWNAVRVMVPKAKVNQLMDDLYEVGARGIIVTALQASRM